MNSPAIEASNQREIFLGGIRLFIDFWYLDDSKNRPVDVPRLLHHALRAAGAIGGVAVEGDGGLGASESIKNPYTLTGGLKRNLCSPSAKYATHYLFLGMLITIEQPLCDESMFLGGND